MRAHAAAAQERDRPVGIDPGSQLVEEAFVADLRRVVVPLDVDAAGHVAHEVSLGVRARVHDLDLALVAQRPRFGRCQKPRDRLVLVARSRSGRRDDFFGCACVRHASIVVRARAAMRQSPALGTISVPARRPPARHRRRPDGVPADLVDRTLDRRGLASGLHGRAGQGLRDRDPGRAPSSPCAGSSGLDSSPWRAASCAIRWPIASSSTSSSPSCPPRCSGSCSGARSRLRCSPRCRWRSRSSSAHSSSSGRSADSARVRIPCASTTSTPCAGPTP